MIFEAFVIGLITLIVGKIGFYLVYIDDKNKEKKPSYDLVLFLIGFILHFIIEFVGLNKWYCDKCII
jgi:hypothetical protein